MRFRPVFIAFIVGALLTVSIPVVAHHVLEPVAPIESLALRLYQYPHQSATLFKCDGTDSVNWDAIRIETDVLVNAVPSEHWEQRLIVSQITNGSARKIWDAFWRHQNQGAHRNPPNNSSTRIAQRLMESSQNNQYQLQEHIGMWQVTTIVEGAESLRHFEATCIFEVTASGG